jgi:hypothetical protein
MRYAVYEGVAPGNPPSASKVRVIYLLNTEYDTPNLCDLWVDGRICRRLLIEPSEMNVVYERGGIVLAPGDRGVEIEGWKSGNGADRIYMFLRKDQRVRVFNLSDRTRSVDLNGSKLSLRPGTETTVSLKKRVDPERPAFYDAAFLDEPETISVLGGPMPY